jgi:ABC-type transporter Mla MlaB component
MYDALAARGNQLELSGPVTLATVPDLHRRLLAHLAADGAYTIDAAGVVALDAAGAQLLYAFRHEATHHRAVARWGAVSAAMLDAARALGMAACLGLSDEGLSWQP